MPGRQLDAGGQGPRAGDLHLERTRIALGLRLEGVEVAFEEVRARRMSRPVRAVSRQPEG